MRSSSILLSATKRSPAHVLVSLGEVKVHVPLVRSAEEKSFISALSGEHDRIRPLGHPCSTPTHVETLTFFSVG